MDILSQHQLHLDPCHGWSAAVLK